MKLWDTTTGREILTLHGHGGEVTSIAFSPDGRRLASVGSDLDLAKGDDAALIRLWDTTAGKEVLACRGHAMQVWSVAFSPDGRRLASANGETVTLWDAATGQKVLTLRGHSGAVKSVAFSPDGQRLASAGGPSFVGKPHEVKLWDATTGREIFTLSGHIGPISGVSFSPNGGRLASAGWDGR